MDESSQIGAVQWNAEHSRIEYRGRPWARLSTEERTAAIEQIRALASEHKKIYGAAKIAVLLGAYGKDGKISGNVISGYCLRHKIAADPKLSNYAKAGWEERRRREQEDKAAA